MNAKTRQRFGECKKCGKCCDPLILFYSVEEIQRMALDGDIGAKFALQNFTEISEEEAFSKNPYLESFKYQLMDDNGVLYGGAGIHNHHYFTCRHFDAETKMCSAYDARTNLCRNFPFYEFDHLWMFTLYSPSCGFNDARNFQSEAICDREKYGIIIDPGNGRSIARELYFSKIAELTTNFELQTENVDTHNKFKEG